MKKLLILDLDETIIHATETPLGHTPDFMILGQYHVYRRPFLDEFLRFCFEHFRVGVWTSSSLDYAQAVVAQAIEPIGPLEFLWDRERCTNRYDAELGQSYFVKDLGKLKKRGYALEQVLMIDDSKEKLERNYGNYIRVAEFTGQQGDEELRKLMLYLPKLVDVENVRTVEKRFWKSG